MTKQEIVDTIQSMAVAREEPFLTNDSKCMREFNNMLYKTLATPIRPLLFNPRTWSRAVQACFWMERWV